VKNTDFHAGQAITASSITHSLKAWQYIAVAAGSDVLAYALFDR
jgi:hypothetical protein